MKLMKIQCPSCKIRVDDRQLSKIAKLFPFDGAVLKEGEGLRESLLTLLSKHPSMYQWACDKCLKDQKAILGNPKKQHYQFKYPWDVANPYLSYFDQQRTCKTCSTSFLFSKEEQQHWYEQLSFVVYAQAVNCKNCRKEIRAKNNLNTELSNLLKEGVPTDKTQLERIAKIYELMGKEDKMKSYLKAAKKIQ